VLLVSKESHELLAVDWSTLGVNVPLAVQTAHIDEHIGVGDDSRHGAEDVFVHLVQLTTLTSWDEEI